MMAVAEKRARSNRVRYVLADLRTWVSESTVDVIISNATFQWVPQHVELLDRFVSMLNPDGWLAFQVPGNFDSPSHRVLSDLLLTAPWCERLDEGSGAPFKVPHSVLEPREYLAQLTDLGCAVDAWETTYYHALKDEESVLEWMKGTALRPVLSALPNKHHQQFLYEYANRLRPHYPPTSAGIVLPFRRILVVANR